MPSVLTVEAARQIIIQHCQQIDRSTRKTETIPLSDSLGRVLAERVFLDRDYPAFDRSMRDGFAVRDTDVREVPAILRCVGEVAAGQTPDVHVEKGEAVRIMTGAAVPQGATAVIMVEDTENIGDQSVKVSKVVNRGANIALKGSERLASEPVCEPWWRISPAHLATLASTGKTHVKVCAKPSVAILATGNELVSVSERPGPFQIRNSNSFGLVGQVIRHGGEPYMLQTARDEREDLYCKILLGLEKDILLVSGGVSMGKYDLVEPVFADLGIQVHFDAVSMRPGKPVVFGTWKDRFVFGLPGNPVSTFVTCELFVSPLLEALQGLSFESLPLVRGVFEGHVSEKSGRTAFLPANAALRGEELVISLCDWRGSSDLFGLVQANALAIVPRELAVLQNGDEIDALLFDTIEYGRESRF